ncbi:hypothetical protein AB0O20_28670 [Streptomyces kronopolitis]|uniref:hypothetical protein n=1 Tax=Streptomyces kronopolitis TaxID=1612435 RepID=UPI003447500C
MHNPLRALARLFRRPAPAVSGPYRLYVRRTPTGVLLDVEHFLVATVEAIADDPERLALLLEIAEDRGTVRPYDGHRPESLLVEQLVGELGYEIPLYGSEVSALADRLRAVAPVVRVPRPRAEGGAA